MSDDGAIVLHRLDLEARVSIATAHGEHAGRPLYLLSAEGRGEGYAEVVGLPAPAPGDPDLDEVVASLTGYVLPLLAERSERRGRVGEPGQLRPSLNGERSSSFACHAVEALLLDRWSRASGGDLADLLAEGVRVDELARTWLVDTQLEPQPGPGDRIRAKVDPVNAVAVADAMLERYPGHELALDANGSFSYLEADALDALVGQLADRPGLVLEQPLARQDLAGHAQLRQRGLRIYLDESASSLQAIRAVARYEAADGVLLKPARLGGAIATVQALEACRTLGLAAGVGGMLEAELGRSVLRVLAAHPAATLAGDLGPSSEYLAVDPTVASPTARDGRGFGVNAGEACQGAVEVARFPLALGDPLDSGA